jgi:DNA-binding transcriptional MerR regulator
VDLMDVYDITHRLGITYRQLDYWSRQGWLRPATPANGSGTRREWTNDELAVAARMAKLVNAGLPPNIAADAARKGDEVWLTPDVHIAIRR